MSRASASAPQRVLLLLAALLALLPFTGARGQAVHTHDWEAVDNLPSPQLHASHTYPAPGQLVALTLASYENDLDSCLSFPQGEGDAPCPFPANVAVNGLHPVAWTDMNRGGLFGYLDENGQFVTTTDPALVTHYQVPDTSGYLPLMVTVDDVPQALDPDSAAWVSTHDDATVTGSVLLIVTPGSPHTHDWQAMGTIPTPVLRTERDNPTPGSLVAVDVDCPADTDRCLAGTTSQGNACPFPGNTAENAVVSTAWSDGGAGGSFGYLDANGQFVAATNPDQVTHYQCPPAAASVILSVTVDDIPQAYEPGSGSLINTYDDPPRTNTHTLGVAAENPHGHDWEPATDLPAPEIRVETNTPEPGQVVALFVPGLLDTDLCLDLDQLPCGFPGDLAPNLVRIIEWSDGGAGGAFGFLDDTGQFVSSTLPEQITHYRTPLTAQMITVQVTVDDVPFATQMSDGYTVPTYNDAPRTAVAPMNSGGGSGSHPHTWRDPGAGLGISAPYSGAWSISGTPKSGRVIGISVQYQPREKDSCTNTDGRCNLEDSDSDDTTQPWRCTYNLVKKVAWSDGGAGGQFGYRDASGKFVVSSDAALITHYRCPPVTGTSPQTVTLRVTLDDDPDTGHETSRVEVRTFDDNSVPGTYDISVQPGHAHSWEAYQPVPVPSISYSGATTIPSATEIPISASVGSSEQDRCTVTNPACNLGNYVSNTVKGKWSTSNRGEFGYYQNSRWVASTDAAQVTHFRCPKVPTGEHWAVVLTVTADDDPKITETVEDVTSTIDTYDDPTASASRTLTVDGPPQPPIDTMRDVAAGDLCPMDGEAPGFSTINPRTGRVSFDVPVTSWGSQGRELEFGLSYTSCNPADPALDGQRVAGLDAIPEFAHLAVRNSHWTHTFAQFVEVVRDEAGEVHALWHAGDGGQEDFDLEQTGTWGPHNPYDSLSSAGPSISWTVYGGELPSFTASSPWSSFTATDGEGTQYLFGQVTWQVGIYTAIPYYRLTRITDRWGRYLTLLWSGNQLQSVKDGNQRGLTFTYVGGLLDHVTDPNFRTHHFYYSDVNCEFGYPVKKLTKVEVEGPAEIVSTWQFGYQSSPTPSGSRWPTTAPGTYTGDFITWKREPNGKQVYYGYESVSRLNPGAKDYQGCLSVEWFQDDDVPNNVKIIRRNGDTITYPMGNQVTYGYSGTDLTQVTAGNRSVHYWYDSWHRLTKVWTDLETEAAPLVSLAYVENLVEPRKYTQVTATDRLGHVTVTDFNGRLQPVQVTRPHLPVGTPGYDQKTVIGRDATGNVTSVRRVLNGPDDRISVLSNYLYDLPQAVTDPAQRTWTFVYNLLAPGLASFDSPANPYATFDPNPSHGSYVHSTQTGTAGLLTQFTEPGQVTNWVTYAQTAAGQPNNRLRITTSIPDSASSSVDLDAAGNVVRSVDAAGRVTVATYSLGGLLTSVTEGYGVNGLARTTRYYYDKNGNLTRLDDPKRSVTQFEYVAYSRSDLRLIPDQYEGQVTHIAYPDRTHEYFGYNDAGELEWEKRGYEGGPWLETSYQRDELHRVHQVTYPAVPRGAAGYQVVTDYDEFGRVRQVTDPNGTVVYTYDAVDRPLSVSASDGRGTLTFAYSTEVGSHREITRTTVSGVGTWVSVEDPKGRLESVTNPSGQKFALSYDYGDRLCQQRSYTSANTNPSTIRWEYDGYGRMWRQTFRKPDNTAYETLRYYFVEPTARVRREEAATGGVRTFDYDALGRLTAETGPDLTGGVKYDYDLNDNRTHVQRGTVHEYAGFDAANRLLWVNGAPSIPIDTQQTPFAKYEYDGSGNLSHRLRYYQDPVTRKGVREDMDYGWDAPGNLRSVTRRAGTTQQLFSATYDPSGQRISKTDHLGTHVYRFGLADTYKNTVHTPGFTLREGNVDRLLLPDGLGDTRGILDGTGQQVSAAFRYDAYGLRTAVTGNNADPTANQYKGATGYEREPVGGIGLDYLQQRYYDPSVGRFISRDPIRWAGGLNLYGYCGNDPVNVADPLGLLGEEYDPGWAKGCRNGFGVVGMVIGALGGGGIGGGGGFVVGLALGPGSLATGGAGAWAGGVAGAGGGYATGVLVGQGVVELIKGAGELATYAKSSCSGGNGGRGGGPSHKKVCDDIIKAVDGETEVWFPGARRAADVVDLKGNIHQVGNLRFRGGFRPSARERAAIEDIRKDIGRARNIIFHDKLGAGPSLLNPDLYPSWKPAPPGLRKNP